jgi:hypothetical protein
MMITMNVKIFNKDNECIKEIKIHLITNFQEWSKLTLLWDHPINKEDIFKIELTE